MTRYPRIAASITQISKLLVTLSVQGGMYWRETLAQLKY